MSTLASVDSEGLTARPDAERRLLGAILIDGSLLSRVMEFLVPEDFASEAHRLVYEACLALADRREGVDLSLIHISEPTRLGMISYAVFCLKKKNKKNTTNTT